MPDVARDFDHRQALVELLTTLTEPEQLFYELVQNADDAKAKEITFTFTSSDLTVWNSAEFSKCSHGVAVRPRRCNYSENGSSSGGRCDFHSLLMVYDAHKAKETGTTGKFGIGFNAVFVVSDEPELISNGAHLHFYNDEDDQRIRTCEDHPCSRKCASSSGTTLILPWADQEGSSGRSFYEQPAITPNDFAKYEEAAVASAPLALLFNTHLEKVSVSGRDGTDHRWRRTVDGETVTISSSDSEQRWRTFHRDVSKDSGFYATHRHALEEYDDNKDLRIAVQEGANEATLAGGHQSDGRLFVTFPTEVETHLPVHINAKFQPERNRRRLKLDGDQGKWNKDLVSQAGQAIAGEIVEIREALGSPMLFWDLVYSAWLAAQRGADDLGITDYWDASLKEVLKSQEVIWAESGSWLAVDDVRYRPLDTKRNDRVFDVLGKLGVETVHRQIQQKIEETSAKPILEELGVKELSLTDVAEALKESDLSRGIDQFMGGKHLLSALWEECDRLLKGGQKGARIKPLALWPTTAGSYKSAPEMFRADDDHEIRRIVKGFDLDVDFLDDDMPSRLERLREVVESFQLEHLVDALDASIGSKPNDRIHVDDKQRKRLFKWIHGHKDELEDGPTLKGRLASLPLYPTKQGPRSLDDAYWPTGFKDRLGIVETINTDALSKTEAELLELLGVKELTFETYCTESLPDAFRDGKVKSGQQRDLVEELAGRLKAIEESPKVLEALKGLPLIECAGDEPRFLEPGKAYFNSEDVKGVLGSQAVLAVHSGDTDELLELLGVSDKPRLPDVVKAIATLSSKALDKENKSQVSKTIEFLSNEWPMAKRDDPEDDLEARRAAFARPLEPLRALAWLPGSKGTAWKRPEDLAARVDQNLFEDQAVFLDINKDKQANARAKAFLAWLGLQIEPEPDQVVAQLSHCAESGKRVDWGVYAYLDDQAKSRDDDLFSGPHLDEVFEPLQGRPCLLLEEEGDSGTAFEYLAPHKVFMSPPLFGRYGYPLPPAFQEYPHLLDELGVKETPDAEDAQRLLRELSAEAEADGAALNDEDKGVIKNCWKIFEDQLGKAEDREPEELPNELDHLRELLRQIGQRASFFDQASIPTRPDQLVLNDSYRRFTYLTGQSLAPLVERNGLWNALGEAGAKRLSTDLKFAIVEERLLEDDIPFGELLEERWELIERVVDSHGGDTNARERLQELGPRIEVKSSTTLSATLWIHRTALNQSHPVEINAFFDNENKELLYKSGDSTPWRDIVTELFASLDLPDAVTLWIEQVLNIATVQEAERFLEEHDVPRLPEPKRHEYLSEMPTVGRTVDAQGVSEDTDPDSDGRSSAGTEVPATLGVDTDVSTDANSEFEDEEDGDPRLDPGADLDLGEESSDGWFRGDEESVYPDDDEAVSDDHPDHKATEGSHQGPTKSPDNRRRRRPDRYRSGSPAHTDSEGSQAERPTSARGYSRLPPSASHTIDVGRSYESGLSDEERKLIGTEGESAVIDYESGAGRFPTDMNDPVVVGGYHNHEGWDIESRSSLDGEVERYIEVKARRGGWRPKDIALSAKQLEKAQEKEDRYWLYVVEYLGTDDQKIYRIRNPYYLIGSFYFGPVFRAHAEYSEDGS